MRANLLSSFLILATLAAAQTSTYIGGDASVSLTKMVTDASGNVYVTGSELVSAGGHAAHSVFVAKTDPSGALVYTARFGGKGDDSPNAIAVDNAGGVFVAGSTTSPDFPLLHPIQSRPAVAGSTSFILSLDASGQLLWSTYFGGGATTGRFGAAGSSISAMALDGAGNVYIAGTSMSPDLPTTAGAFQQTGSFFSTVTENVSSGFVAKLSSESRLIYCTWLAGSELDCNGQACQHHGPRIDAPTAIAADTAGHAYVTGYTDSADFPTTPGAYARTLCCTTINQGTDYAFLSELSADGSSLVYSTFLDTLGFNSSEPSPDLNRGLSIDNSGNAYVAFGTSGGFNVDFGGNPISPVGRTQIRIMKMNATGSAAVLSTTLPSSVDQFATALSLDAAGDIFVAGRSAVSDLLFELDPKASTTLRAASFPLGAASEDVATAPLGVLYAIGSSGRLVRFAPFSSGSLPTFFGAGNAANGTIDGGFTDGEIVSLYGTGIGPDAPIVAVPTPLSGEIDAALYPQTLGGISVLINGQPAALLYASSSRINAALRSSPGPITVEFRKNGSTLGSYSLGVASAAPTTGIFRNGDGTAAILNQDGTLNTKDNPAHTPSVISFWGTGIPAIEYLSSGGVPKEAINFASTADVAVVEPGTNERLDVTYAGAAPGVIGGVFQINAVVPADAQSYTYLVVVSGGVSSQPILLYVAP